ncbi:membrane protein [Methylosinus sp. C49]|uniref:heparan-alpha-glucosaminide N-acetyltransferase n=1 Tax=Methylosinus sp. C49 TaxID=2699395 RepID=UPI001366D4E3|nr:heparan-alpha-glucosaminide N-acetyltransferase [Methylosinus sp. C49]BBU60571.1 membrane protein [Methylosinus sp. C49]
MTARLIWLDVARGLAVLAMFAFHFGWDLGHFGHIDPDIPYSNAYKAFGHAIAASFLFIAGLSLTLAQGTAFRARAYWRRLALLIGAALLVSAGTYIAFPSSFVFFGILHCIAAASLLALPFLRLPWPAAFAAGVALVGASVVARGPFFDTPWFWWTGLSTFEPMTNDYRPLAPWAGALLFGVGAAKLARLCPAAVADTHGNVTTRSVALLGRHSLALYLLHQPLFFAGFTAVAMLLAPMQNARFAEACRAQCVASGASVQKCETACDCAAREAAREDAPPDAGTEEGRARLERIARACVAR